VEIALIQKYHKVGDKSANLEAMLSQLESQDVELIVFPELSLTGYNIGDRFYELAETLDGPSVSRLSSACVDNNKHIIFGMPLIYEDDPKVIFNVAILLTPTGDRFVYHKHHLPHFWLFHEKDHFTLGRGVEVFETKLCKIGLCICYDIFFPELFKLMALKGAQLIVCISGAPRESSPYFKRLIEARPLETTTFFAYSNLVGPDGSFEFWGGSQLRGPSGDLIAGGKAFEEDIVRCTVDLGEIEEFRKKRKALQDTRYDLFKALAEETKGRPF